MLTSPFSKLALAFCLTIPALQANACVHWQPQGASSGQSTSLVPALGNPSPSSTTGHNVGVYYYDAITGQSTLTESYYDPNAAAWAYNAGYVVQSDASFAGTSGARGTSGDSAIACFGDDEELPTLPKVTTTALVPPSFLGGGFFLRIIGIGGGGGGGGGSGVNTIKVGAEVYIDNAGCHQSTMERWVHANAAAAHYRGSVRSGDDFIVRMPNDLKEHWTFRCVLAICNPATNHIVDGAPRVNACVN